MTVMVSRGSMTRTACHVSSSCGPTFLEGPGGVVTILRRSVGESRLRRRTWARYCPLVSTVARRNLGPRRTNMKRLIVHAPPLLSEELAQRDCDVVALYYPWFRPNDATLARLRAAEPFDMRLKLDLRAISRMRHLILAHRPDVVHAFSPKSLAAVVVATRGMRQPGDRVVPRHLHPPFANGPGEPHHLPLTARAGSCL